MIVQQVRKVGNSLVVTIPKAEAERLHIVEGQSVAVELTPMELKPVLSAELHSVIDDNRELLTDVMTYLRDK